MSKIILDDQFGNTLLLTEHFEIFKDGPIGCAIYIKMPDGRRISKAFSPNHRLLASIIAKTIH